MIRWIRSLSVAYCHAAKKAATVNTVSVYGAIARSLERPRLRALARTGSLTGIDEEVMGSGDPEQSTDLEHLVLEVFVVDNRGLPRAREIHIDNPGKPARSRAHHKHAVGQEKRLLDVMGDEDGRLAGSRPEPQKFVVHRLPGELVQRPERLVEEHDVG